MVVEEEIFKDNNMAESKRPEKVVKLSEAELLKEQINKEKREHFTRVMIAYHTGEDYPGPGIAEELTYRFFRLSVPLVFLFSNIYIYYFVYHFSFNENFLLIFFFFTFFALVYHYVYFSILNGLDSLSLELYIQFHRLLTIAKQQLLVLKSNLRNFLVMGDGLFITYYQFIHTYLLTVSTLKFISDSFFLSFIDKIFLEMHMYQVRTSKRFSKLEMDRLHIRCFGDGSEEPVEEKPEPKGFFSRLFQSRSFSGPTYRSTLKWRMRGVVIIPRPPQPPRRPRHFTDNYVAPDWHYKGKGWYIKPRPLRERKYLAYSRMPKGVRRKFNNIRQMRKEALERMERSRKAWERVQPYHKAYKIMIHLFIKIRRLFRFLFRRLT